MILQESAERSKQGVIANSEDAEDPNTSKIQKRYVVESIRGFDLFPQTAHVESVAVLRLV